MAQIRTVLKVTIPCEKCKKKLLKSVTSLEGVDKIEVDDAKGTLTVTGNVDPYKVIVKARKMGRHAEVVTVGPPPAPQKKTEEKKPETKKPDAKPFPICSCPSGEIAFIQLGRYADPNPICTIL